MPFFPDVAGIRIRKGIAGHAETGNSAQHRVGKGIQFLQTHQGEAGVVKLPSAPGIFDVELSELSFAYKILRLLPQLRGDGDIGSVKAFERF